MNEPKLRFPEFNSNWTHDNLENVAEIFDGTHQTPLYTKTGVQFVSVENIEDIYKSEKYISHEEYDKYRNKPQINDILMTRITAGVIGETAMVTKDAPLAYYVSLALIRCEKLFPSYVEKYIHSIQFRKELYKRIIHTAFPKKINLGDIGKCLVGITNEQEQQKIAEFLSMIDTVIEKQKETVSAWEERKKGVMQKLFSQEVRFKADDGSDFPEWEEQKLGEYLIQYTEKTTENNQYPVLTSSRKGIYLQDDYYGRQVASENNIGYNIVPYGYFTYRHMSDDLIFRFNINNIVEKGIVSTLYPVFTVTDKIDSNFLQSYLNESTDFFKYCMLQKQGGSRTYMYFGKLKDFVAHFPCFAEQQKIADCLSSLDEVIEKQKATLAAWEALKKGLLQQMFA